MYTNAISKLAVLLLERLSNGLTPSVYLNVQNPKFLSIEETKSLHKEFIKKTKQLKVREIDASQEFLGIEQELEVEGEPIEVLVEKISSVDDNILLISLSQPTVVSLINKEVFSDVSFVKEYMKDSLGAKEVTIKLTY